MSSGVIAAPAGAALLDVSFVDLVSEEVWADADPAAAAARTATRATRCASIITSPELKDCCFSICGPALWSRTGPLPYGSGGKGWISTRRFAARPWGVVSGVRGLVAPYPRATICWNGTPFATR